MVVPLAFGWRALLFANWPVDGDVLAAHLPEDLSVDERDGTGWLSVVPFANVRLRPRGLPGRAGVRLPEVNLRTYVTCDGEPGVYFFSLDAQGVLSVLGARLFHHLPYYYARIRIRRADGRVSFTSRRLHPGARPARYSVRYRPVGDPFVPASDSLAAFLTERRRFYTQAPDGALRYTDVEHDRWTLCDATATTAENTLLRASGFALPDAEPTYYYSHGLDVVAGRNRRWDR